MRQFRKFWVVAMAMMAIAGLVSPAGADQFDWSQNGGFFFPGANDTSTLMGGSVNNTYGPPIAGNGGLEFGLPTAAPAPPDTHRAVVWGCTPDGDNDNPADADGVCANGGTLANATVGGDPTNPLAAGRSALKVTVFNSSQSGVLDSITQTPVVIARLDHFNRVIDNESNSLNAIEIRANLVITELGGAPQVTNSANSVPITFIETNNFPDGDPSTPADCEAAGFLNPLGSVCDDEFTFDTSSFANVPFSHDGKNFFIQFGLSPVPECDTPAGSVGTIDFFQCDDNVNHQIAIDFINGKAWAKEGFDNAIQVTMFLTEEPVPPPLRTVTQGGWGAPPNGNNNGKFLQNNFAALGGNVVIGDGGAGCFQLTFTSSNAIKNFLPQGGKPAALKASQVDPNKKITVFAGQVLALTLNVKFSDLGLLPPGLGDLILQSGPATGKTVAQVLADANKALGCGTLPAYVTNISQLNDIVTSINEMFDV